MYSVIHSDFKEFFRSKGYKAAVGFLKKGEFVPFPANVDLTKLEARQTGPIIRVLKKDTGQEVTINLPVYPGGKGLPSVQSNYVNKMYQKCLNEFNSLKS